MKGDFSRRIFDAGKYAGVLHQQGRVWLDSDWNEQTALQFERLREETADLIGPSGFSGTAFQISASSGNPADFQIAHGRAYLDGVLCRLPADASYLHQPFLLDPPAIPIPQDGSTLNALIYLEAWARPISYLQDPAIREVALGGPDTTMRIQTVAQIKLVQVPATVTDLTCPNAGSLLPATPDGTLTVIQNPPPPPTDICRIPDLGTYTGRENRLYRVEIHSGGAVRGSVTSPPTKAAPATFKWSRDNAGFAVGVTALSQDRLTLTLTSLGRDQATALQQGDLVEISDDASELGPGAGFLTNLASDPDLDQIKVTLASPLPSSFQNPGAAGSPPTVGADRHLILRRWDGSGTVSATFDPTATPDLDLGDGIQIQFGGTQVQAGDYWQFAARTDGSVEPLNGAPPQGIRRHRTALALAQWTRPVTSPPSSPPASYSMAVLHDCRTVFPPLAEPALHVQSISLNGANGPLALLNDRSVAIADLSGGIDVLLDAAPAPAAITRAVCALEVEVPAPLSSATGAYEKAVADPQKTNVGFQPTVLVGDATANGNVISWRLRHPEALNGFPFELLPPGEPGLLARFRINGNFVWAQDNPNIFLDGDVFGVRQLRVIRAPREPVLRGATVTDVRPVILADTGIRLPSGDGRKGGMFETWFWIAPPPTLGFTLTVPTVPVLRSIGGAELIGDLVVTISGGVPTAAGAAVPAFTIRAVLDQPITSLAVDASNTEALLLIDDPSTLNTAQLLTSSRAALTGGGGSGLDYKNGKAPNTFLGSLVAGVAGVVEFANIPIDSPGPGQTRTIRITNLRVNLFQLAVTGAPLSPPTHVSASVTGLPQALGPVTAATVGNGLAAFEVHNGQDVLGNPFTLTFPMMSGTGTQPKSVAPHAFLHFREGFTSSFKNKDQESGYTNPILKQIGQATQGTRLRAIFTGVPAGASIFVSLANVSPTPSVVVPEVAALVTTDATGTGTGTAPVAVGTTNANSKLAALTITNGVATAVWEIAAAADPATLQELAFAVVLGVSSANVAGSVALSGSLVPATTTASVAPRFANTLINVSPAFTLLPG
jgi:hypothetical protein